MDHCEWETIRQEMAEEERRSLMLATACLLVMIFCAGLMVGTIIYARFLA